jgi:integrase/recombinase XerD
MVLTTPGRDRVASALAVSSALVTLNHALTPEAADALETAIGALRDRLESAHSERAYREDWARFCAWLVETHGPHPLAVQPIHVVHYMAALTQRGLAKSTRARALAVLRGIYGALVVAGQVATNPAREVKNPRVSSEPKTPWLSEDTIRRLLDDPGEKWIEQRDRLVALTLLGMSLRRAEIARLDWRSFQSAPNGLAVAVRAKGNKEAIVPVPVWLSEKLRAWRTLNGHVGEWRGPVFPRHHGASAPIGPSTVYGAVKRLAERAGIDPSKVTPHAFRRSFATLTGQRGVSLEDRQAAMLHSSRATTERYDKAAKLPQNAPGEVLRDLVDDNNHQGGLNRDRQGEAGGDRPPPRRAR